MHPHRLDTPGSVLTMMLAGNCTMTVKSVKTGNRFTFKITKGKKKVNPRTGQHYPPMYFVNLLTGPDNTRDYAALGCLRGEAEDTLTGAVFPTFGSGRWCKVSPTCISYRAFDWLYTLVVGATVQGESQRQLPEDLEVWHEGTCGRCGRKLTVPESIAVGIGPECLTKTLFF